MKEFIEKLIGRLEEIKTDNFASAVLNEPYSMGICHTIEKSIEIVNQLAEEYRQDLDKNSQGWLLCSERLPEEEHDYLICDDKGNVYSSTYCNNRWLVNFATDEVIAWQPLPEPFKPIAE